MGFLLLENTKEEGMQERIWTNKDILTNEVSNEDFFNACKKKENKFVALHKPGSDVTLSDGTKYKVDKNGAWRKMIENH